MLTNRKLTDRQLRWFGASLAAVFLAFAMLAIFRWQSQSWGVFFAGAAVCLAALYYGLPETQRPIYETFLKITYPIQFVVTVLLLGLVYFAVLTPIGLLMRLRGYDPLDRHRRDNQTSFWHHRQSNRDPKRYFKTF